MTFPVGKPLGIKWAKTYKGCEVVKSMSGEIPPTVRSGGRIRERCELLI
jgi:hypothetical protein